MMLRQRNGEWGVRIAIVVLGVLVCGETRAVAIEYHDFP